MMGTSVSDFPRGLASNLLLACAERTDPGVSFSLRALSQRLIAASAVDFLGGPEPHGGRNGASVLYACELVEAGRLLKRKGLHKEAKALQELLAVLYGRVACEILAELAFTGGELGEMARVTLLQVMAWAERCHRPESPDDVRISDVRRYCMMMDRTIQLAGGSEYDAFRGGLNGLWCMEESNEILPA